MKIKKLKVSLDFGTSPIEVGTLLLQDQIVYFRYAASFLDAPLDISPFKSKNKNSISTYRHIQEIILEPKFKSGI
jgi:hypothetical protein